MLTKILGPAINSSPVIKKLIWKRWYQFLAGGYKQEDWTFMNYGFAQTDSHVQDLVLRPADENDRYNIQLYDRIVEGVDLLGLDVLEVGSGRGGGSSYIARYHKPKSMLGIDYSDNAVDFSSKAHSTPGLSFRKGDAEALPCENGSFDAILNVESSHCYGSMDRFLNEVFRVLKPGGYFLWADMLSPAEVDAYKVRFEKAGFQVIEATNITPNVVVALDRVEARKRETIKRHVPKVLMNYFEDFAGVPGTRVYDSLKESRVQYRYCKLKKPAATK